MALPSAATAPLAITAGLRAPRTGVFVPPCRGLPWASLFEQALANRVGVWGGAGDLLFPLEDGLEAHPLFWRLADLLDADSYVVHGFSGDDLAELDPAAHEQALNNIRERAHDEDHANVMLTEFLSQPLSDPVLPDVLHRALIQRVAPRTDGAGWVAHAPREEGGAPFEPPTVGVEQLGTPPGGPWVNPSTALSDTHALLLTTEVGRFTRRTSEQLRDVGLSVQARDVAAEQNVNRALFEPRQESSRLPLALSEYGLKWYRRQAAPLTKPILVTGGDV